MNTATQQRTPGPWLPSSHNAPVALVCGCIVSTEYRSYRGGSQVRGLVDHCPLHLAAREMLAELGPLVEWMATSHIKCDIDDDRACYAEQYGDGDAEQHARIRRVRALLARIEAT